MELVDRHTQDAQRLGHLLFICKMIYLQALCVLFLFVKDLGHRLSSQSLPFSTNQLVALRLCQSVTNDEHLLQCRR